MRRVRLGCASIAAQFSLLVAVNAFVGATAQAPGAALPHGGLLAPTGSSSRRAARLTRPSQWRPPLAAARPRLSVQSARILTKARAQAERRPRGSTPPPTPGRQPPNSPGRTHYTRVMAPARRRKLPICTHFRFPPESVFRGEPRDLGARLSPNGDHSPIVEVLPDHVALIRGSEEFAYVFLALVRDSLVGESAPGLRVILRIRRLIENGEHARRVCFVGVVVYEGSRLDRPGLLLGRRDLGRPGGRPAMAERPFAGLALERSLRATTATCPTTGVLSARSSRPFPTGCRGAGARRKPSRERPAHHCGDACSPQTERK